MNSSSKLIINNIVNSIQKKKGYDIAILEVKELSSLTDFFIICSSDSDPQTRAITNCIKKDLSKTTIKPYQIEGLEDLDWVLMDYHDIVIHIFKKEIREFYNIERLWADAKIKTIKND
tara:strand:+ start:523 stop:876 length:354 start_codon:yes stop_codon:yes gene_type:complete